MKDAFVLCRIFQKSGSGPKNGEQYGAPFVEEEWEDDEVGIMPKEEAAEEFEVADDAYLDGNDLEQVCPFFSFLLFTFDTYFSLTIMYRSTKCPLLCVFAYLCLVRCSMTYVCVCERWTYFSAILVNGS